MRDSVDDLESSDENPTEQQHPSADDNAPGVVGAAAEEPNEDDPQDEENIEEEALIYEEEDEDTDDEDPLAHLPDYVVARVAHLRVLDDEREQVLQEYIAERSALEKKFSEKFRPLYVKRKRIVNGEEDLDDARRSMIHLANREVLMEGVPQFWLSVMTRNDVCGEWITENDCDCLEALVDIQCFDKDDGKGFKLDFYFAPNLHFHNAILSKDYDIPNLYLPGEPLIQRVTGTKIHWKPGRALTFRTILKKQRGKGKHAGQVRTVTKREDVESFFKWFEVPEMPSLDSLSEEEAAELEETFESDYELAEAFRTQVIPRAVVWFAGEDPEAELALTLAAAEAGGGS